MDLVIGQLEVKIKRVSCVASLPLESVIDTLVTILSDITAAEAAVFGRSESIIARAINTPQANADICFSPLNCFFSPVGLISQDLS